LTDREMERIHHTVLDVMENYGFADAIPSMIELITAAGGWMSEDGRLHFPRSLVEDIIAKAPKNFIMPGQDPKHDLEIGGNRVHMGTGGAAPEIIDFKTGRYRESTSTDLYDIARLVDTLDNIHFFWRTNITRDAPTMRDVDLNTVYASMSGTTKHIGVSFVIGEHVYAAVEMMDYVLGGEGGFRKRPFCSISCCHVVPPLRFAQESCDALEAAARTGMPITLLSAAQAGATSPAALAGTIVQAISETLAGLIFVYLIDPNCRANLGTWPFVSDLRTGAMCAGAPELALLVAGCSQMAGYYNLPNSCAAGMTDSKTPDAQAGMERGYTLSLAAHAGADLIMESAGMHASLMASCLESFVIDNDNLGAVNRTVRGIEVSDETLSYELIGNVIHGEGHFLGSGQTIERMETDYFYPPMGDRYPPAVWEEMGSTTIRDRARQRVVETLRQHYPSHIDAAKDEEIRRRFNIVLPRENMLSSKRRW
jgi:trimethylamine--corrinoid protein Co-methyltransferase